MLNAVSTEPCIICCGVSNLELMKAFDEAPSQKAGIQNPLSLSPVQIENLMHKQSFSVIGKIIMFSMLRALSIRLTRLLDERWTHSKHHFWKVFKFS